MPHFNHILFPVDFSAQCVAIRPSVLSIAHQLGARLTLLHVLQPFPSWYGAMGANYTTPLDVAKLKEDLRQRLITFAGDTCQSMECVVLENDPASGIVSFAAANDVDLIMMPTHGYGVFRRLLLGSVTAKVLHDANCAVWTSAHAREIPASDHPSVKHVVCAVDLEAASLPLIRYSEKLAEATGAKVRLAHAVTIVPDPAKSNMNLDFRLSLLHSGREEVARLQETAGTSFTVDVEEGTPAHVVSESARHFQADLVIVGRGKIQGRFGGFRTNAYAIIRESPCPVLSI